MAKTPKPLAELSYSWVGAGINTLDASRWTVWMAKLFGRRFTGEDMNKTIVGYEWRGKLYLTDYH
ncbi:hypothetical protein [Pseudorhodoplanes sinuspersici]|uniref:Uncharacterized protein n=1 Tax=Pseudorhodoplanes sinuspersici TaxID=1235591 RepID=A0A1W6ZX29_9HYPH|nr:hypothetical protein [Pseudorhodoplanes sinuspersici]ARQ01870.1 hypothetical protein CAK95_24320 [Pseudorhodoplanes sinuspersici]RKE73635.1 hypothetical protein DFP91_1529 [Pseudorhodoplanes sinuspersici]